MNLVDLHKTIVNKSKQSLYIFSGEEIYVRDTYVHMISKVFANSMEIHCDTVSEAFNAIKKPRISPAARVFVVGDDKTYLKEEKAWEKVNNTVSKGIDILILTYSTMDKRSKFYKQNKDIICEFEKLPVDMLTKYINRDIELSADSVSKLIEVCGGNYNRIRLEEDKIKQYAEATGYDTNRSFEILLNMGVIHSDIGDITFDFTDSIMLYDLPNIHKYLLQAKAINEAPLLTLSVLYNGLRNVFLVQSVPLDMKNISSVLGLTPWQVKLAKEKRGVYSNEDILYMLKVITKAEQGIKTGMIEEDIAVDYVLVNIL